MSGDIEIVRAMYTAFADGDYAAALAHLAEDVRWDPAMPDQGELRGKEALVALFTRWLGTWEGYSMELVEVVGAGDGKVVATFRQRGTGKGSRMLLDEEAVGVHEVRDGKVASWRRYATREEALRAVDDRARGGRSRSG